MLFSDDAIPGIADGSITVTFRTWKTPHAKAAGRYRVRGLLLEATAVERVVVGSITTADARAAGATDLDALLARLGNLGPDELVWRVDFVLVGADDRIARRNDDAIGDDELREIRARLDRFDRSRPWTRTTLRLIERYPGIVSSALARHAGQERPAFKLNVRKLKELGLTESLEIGYRLSPRGEAVLRSLT